ncbi:transcriptional repressor [Thiohalocapsa halophila]|uniref:Ferric uptake regulation protein n=1 Tax=Thiohalocapsa halophila TaxID=69359 RepID=A0ABS1CJ88_9GAMM|nr:transcriptional repressor [Thiohalocapsa halophila]MBK1631980.1 transcriptional repressor [Thiohalocapsa halophila]
MDETTLTHALSRAEALCRERGVRLTKQRRRVLELVCRANRPVGAYELLDQLRDGGSAAPPTVYRALDWLLAQGLVHKLETLHAFIGCTHPEHPHASQFLICNGCGGVTELEDQAIAGSLASVAAESGFRPSRPVVEVIGTCSDCAQKDGEE